jgi:REP element-mobilizing transposase RayT
VIGAYKSLTTFEYTRSVKTHSWSPFNGRLWQRNYYEHIVRDEESLGRIRQYIIDNPAQWMFDQENPMSGMPQDANP